MERFLRAMFERRATLEWSSENPQKLAYKIREAIHASKHHEKYRHFFPLLKEYEIKAMRGLVQAKFVGLPAEKTAGPVQQKTESAEELGDEEEYEESEVVAQETPPIQVQDVNSLMGIIGAYRKYKSSTREMYFPNVMLLKEEKLKLYKACQKWKWKMIDHDEEGVTITRRPVDDSITWSPEEQL